MDQKKIMEFLNEAANPTCTKERRNNISCELSIALTHGATYSALFEKVYKDIVYSRPDLLPNLFPFFAIICGNLKENGISYVDWSLIPKK